MADLTTCSRLVCMEKFKSVCIEKFAHALCVCVSHISFVSNDYCMYVTVVVNKIKLTIKL